MCAVSLERRVDLYFIAMDRKRDGSRSASSIEIDNLTCFQRGSKQVT